MKPKTATEDAMLYNHVWINKTLSNHVIVAAFPLPTVQGKPKPVVLCVGIASDRILSPTIMPTNKIVLNMGECDVIEIGSIFTPLNASDARRTTNGIGTFADRRKKTLLPILVANASFAVCRMIVQMFTTSTTEIQAVRKQIYRMELMALGQSKD